MFSNSYQNIASTIKVAEILSLINYWLQQRYLTQRLLLCANTAFQTSKRCYELSDTTYHACKHHKPLFQKNCWKEHTLWSDGYLAASVGTVSQSIIEHYIGTQIACIEESKKAGVALPGSIFRAAENLYFPVSLPLSCACSTFESSS